MGKATQWFKNFLTVKKEKCGTTCQCPSAEPLSGSSPTLGLNERGSFRTIEQKSAAAIRGLLEADVAKRKKKKHAAATAALQDVAAAIRLTAIATEAVEEDAAIKIQSNFRSYLARKALSALKGLVKLQAMIRGDIVRRQTTAALLHLHTILRSQNQTRSQRIQMIDEVETLAARCRQNNYGTSLRESGSRQCHEMEENVKIVEMDHCESRSRSKNRNNSKSPTTTSYKGQTLREDSQSRSSITDTSSRAISGCFEECSYSFGREEECPLFPNYMADTESSRAKARSHSTPKQRPDSSERTPSRRRLSVDGSKNVIRRRSSSFVGNAGADGYRSTKLDKSDDSLQESECGSTSTKYTGVGYPST